MVVEYAPPHPHAGYSSNHCIFLMKIDPFDVDFIL